MSQGRKVPKSVWNKFADSLLKNGGSITATARMFDIDPRTVYYQMSRDPEFAQKIQGTFDTIVVPILEQQLFAMGLNKDYRAIRFILLNRSPRRWNTEFVLKTELEIETARALKRIRDGEKDNRYDKMIARYPSFASLLAKKVYHLAARGGDIPEDLDAINLEGLRKHYESYREKREQLLRERGLPLDTE